MGGGGSGRLISPGVCLYSMFGPMHTYIDIDDDDDGR